MLTVNPANNHAPSPSHASPCLTLPQPCLTLPSPCLPHAQAPLEPPHQARPWPRPYLKALVSASPMTSRFLVDSQASRASATCR